MRYKYITRREMQMKLKLLLICLLTFILFQYSYAEEPTSQMRRFDPSSIMCLNDTDSTPMMGRCDTSGYLDVNVKSGGFVGSATPSDAFTNPTTASVSYSLLGAYDTSGWNMLRTAYADGLAVTGILGVGLMGWNGTTFDRVDIDANDALYVNPGVLDNDTDDMSILPHPDVVSANITADASTSVKGTAGDLLKIIVGVAGTGASTTAILYNDADCASLPAAIGTIDTTATGVWPLNIAFSAGLCVVTSNGTTDANIIVVYR